MNKKVALVGIILLVAVFNLFRFYKLDAVPEGYQIDELGSAVTVECFKEQGCDAELEHWPLFGAMQFGQDKPPTYVYPGMIWAKVFGASVPSLRAFGGFVFLLGLMGLFFLAKDFGGKSYALTVVLAATCSPWCWVANRVALESNLAPLYAIGGLYFFWRSTSWWDWVLAGFLLACAMYSYPPARLQIPLMMVTLAAFEWGRRPVRWKPFLSFGIVFILSLLPMIIKYMHGALTRRFDEIGIFNKDFLFVTGKTGNVWDIISVFVHNYCTHLSADFLFLTGDPTYLYSTRQLGILSVIDMGALIIFVVLTGLIWLRPSWNSNPVIKHRRWLLFLAVNFFIGIIPSAMTNQDLPNALRINGAWPFMMLFTGLMWWSACQCLTGLWPVVALTGALCGGILMFQYFTVYPQESRQIFGAWAKDVANRLSTQEDWKNYIITFHRQQYHCRYYLVERLKLSCKDARDVWWNVTETLKNRGMY